MLQLRLVCIELMCLLFVSPISLCCEVSWCIEKFVCFLLFLLIFFKSSMWMDVRFAILLFLCLNLCFRNLVSTQMIMLYLWYTPSPLILPSQTCSQVTPIFQYSLIQFKLSNWIEIILVGPRAVKSNWCRQVISKAWARANGMPGPVISDWYA